MTSFGWVSDRCIFLSQFPYSHILIFYNLPIHLNNQNNYLSVRFMPYTLKYYLQESLQKLIHALIDQEYQEQPLYYFIQLISHFAKASNNAQIGMAQLLFWKEISTFLSMCMYIIKSLFKNSLLRFVTAGQCVLQQLISITLRTP